MCTCVCMRVHCFDNKSRYMLSRRVQALTEILVTPSGIVYGRFQPVAVPSSMTLSINQQPTLRCQHVSVDVHATHSSTCWIGETNDAWRTMYRFHWVRSRAVRCDKQSMCANDTCKAHSVRPRTYMHISPRSSDLPCGGIIKPASSCRGQHAVRNRIIPKS